MTQIFTEAGELTYPRYWPSKLPKTLPVKLLKQTVTKQ